VVHFTHWQGEHHKLLLYAHPILDYLCRILRFTNLEVCPSPFVPSPTRTSPSDKTNYELTNYKSSIIYVRRGKTTEDLPTTRPTLHRPDRRARADLHDILPNRAPLHHLRHLPPLQITLRRVLHKSALRAGRRPRSLHACLPRARLPRRHRLVPFLHLRRPPVLLRQPRRALGR
jgi:hypothetical protein